jgi:hypothetical protein
VDEEVVVGNLSEYALELVWVARRPVEDDIEVRAMDELGAVLKGKPEGVGALEAGIAHAKAANGETSGAECVQRMGAGLVRCGAHEVGVKAGDTGSLGGNVFGKLRVGVVADGGKG